MEFTYDIGKERVRGEKKPTKRQVDAITQLIEKKNKGNLIDELKIPNAKHKAFR